MTATTNNPKAQMTSISYDSLAQHLEKAPHTIIEVHAVDPMIYVAYVATEKCLTPIVDRKGNARFPSQSAVQRALREAGVSTITFVHKSAYNEMVGLDNNQSDTEMRQIIRLRTDAV